MPAIPPPLPVEHWYRTYRPLLISIAYRMLGSISEAEDVVQDVFVNISKLEFTPIHHPKSYLVKMVTNRLLNVMKSAPRRREHYPGTWLPEPLIYGDDDNPPQTHVLRNEQIGYALLVLLQNCTPAERAVFVLRESFQYSYGEIASMLDKSEAACRKLFSRATAKIGQARTHQPNRNLVSEAAMDRFVQTFTEALRGGHLEPFLSLLTQDAVMLSDGGGVVRAALRPIFGSARISAFFKGIARKGVLSGTVHAVRLSGQSGILLERPSLPPIAFALLTDTANQAITAIYLVSNPHKLVSWAVPHAEQMPLTVKAILNG